MSATWKSVELELPDKSLLVWLGVENEPEPSAKELGELFGYLDQRALDGELHRDGQLVADLPLYGWGDELPSAYANGSGERVSPLSRDLLAILERWSGIASFLRRAGELGFNTCGVLYDEADEGDEGRIDLVAVSPDGWVAVVLSVFYGLERAGHWKLGFMAEAQLAGYYACGVDEGLGASEYLERWSQGLALGPLQAWRERYVTGVAEPDEELLANIDAELRRLEAGLPASQERRLAQLEQQQRSLKNHIERMVGDQRRIEELIDEARALLAIERGGAARGSAPR